MNATQVFPVLCRKTKPYLIFCCAQEAKVNGDSLSVETCPHYLAFTAEEIQDGDTRFKCAPPIRDASNREKLWEALMVLLIFWILYVAPTPFS